jgi:hypothetical protein
MIKPGRYDFIDGAHKLWVKSDLILALHEIAARGDETRYRADVRLYTLSYLQGVPPKLP